MCKLLNTFTYTHKHTHTHRMTSQTGPGYAVTSDLINVFTYTHRYGRSLGSGPTCQLAEELARAGVELGGVMLQSPLASAFRVAFNFRFTMPGDLFPNIDRAKNLACPVFIIHGTR